MSILIYGIKIGKYFHQFLTLPYPPIVIFSKIGLKSKSGFVWIFFQKTKWTHVSVKNLDGQVSNPKNIATVKVYFSSFPYGTPCIWTLNINGRLDKLVPESVKFAQLLTTFTLVLAWQKLVLHQDIIIMKIAAVVSMLQIDRPGFFYV